MFNVAILTLSDKGAAGQREDETGRVIKEMIEGLDCRVVEYQVIPDEAAILKDRLVKLSDGGGVDLILTNGGTGLSPRDITPQATAEVIEMEVPGIAQAMMFASLQKTPVAMLSRAVAGVRKRTLIINLPGSPRAARENLEAILPALPHAMEKLKGDPSDCAPVAERLRYHNH